VVVIAAATSDLAGRGGSKSDIRLSLDGESEKSSFAGKCGAWVELPIEDGAIGVVNGASEGWVVRGRDDERLGEPDGVMRPSGT